MGVALDLLVQVLHRHSVKFGQIVVEDDFLVAQDDDPRRNSFGKDDCSFVHDAPAKFEVTICDLKEIDLEEQGIIPSRTRAQQDERGVLRLLCQNRNCRASERECLPES